MTSSWGRRFIGMLGRFFPFGKLSVPDGFTVISGASPHVNETAAGIPFLFQPRAR
jgi:hypothetical protein